MNQLSPYQQVEQTLLKKSTINSLSNILGTTPRAKQYAMSVLAEIKKNVGDPRKDLSGCEPTSIVLAIRDAAKLRLEIDGRQHAHLVKYGNKVQLQIGYRGYLARLQSSLEGFAAHVECVYKGDTVEIVQDGLQGKVIHKRGDPFGTLTDKDIIGVYCQLSYIVAGERITIITTMNRGEIDKIRSKAKTSDIWNAWYSEKAKVACLRRACKAHFSSVTNDMDEIDNQAYELDQAAKTEANQAATSSLIDVVAQTPTDELEMDLEAGRP